jgi:copper chaperone CopZ
MRSIRFSSMILVAMVAIQGVFGGGFLTADLHASSRPRETITLKVEGWTCASCEKDLYKALMRVSGVQSADVSYSRGGAVVVVDWGKVTAEQLIEAIRGASNIFDSYQATVVPNGSLSKKREGSGIF